MPNAHQTSPQPAFVRPCVRGPTGERLLLTEAVSAYLASARRGRIAIVGGPGTGKSTAIAHLAAHLSDRTDAIFLDEPAPEEIDAAQPAGWVVYAAASGPDRGRAFVYFDLEPWGVDECIEYLLAKQRLSCASVMRRLQAAVASEAPIAVPLLAAIVLDEMSSDETLADPDDALRRFLDAGLPDSSYRARLGRWSILVRQHNSISPPRIPRRLRNRLDPRIVQMIRQPYCHLLLATERAMADLAGPRPPTWLAQRLDGDFVRQVGRRATGNSPIRQRLEAWMEDSDAIDSFAMIASILHATQSGWRPADDTFPDLTGAHFPGARWPSARLKGIRLSQSDLTYANLTEACLDNADAKATDFSNAILHGASLRNFNAYAARFDRADLSYVRASHAILNFANFNGANLEGALLENASLTNASLELAQLSRANLSGSILTNAKLESADFAGAIFKQADLSRLDLRHVNLAGADFGIATLVCCNLEYQQIAGAVFQKADLTNALLTGSSMPAADLRGARLVGAGLADIDWPDADLRKADFRGASFHTGSSRSGLVGSPIASEGSRTGFYTDEYEEQFFQAPEDIRKANLRGADLRGALVAETDFYLVDLRDALYDPDQEQHFRRCRAILESRVDD